MTLAEGIERFFVDRIRQFEGEPRLYLRLDKDKQTVDWLAADDLAKGFEDELPITEPRRALGLVFKLANVLGIVDHEAEVLRRRLAVQDETTSWMGTHVHIITREQGLEYPGFLFLVHFDQHRRAYMINCVYRRQIAAAPGVPLSAPPAPEIAPPTVRSQPGFGCVYGNQWTKSETSGTMAESCVEVVLRDVEEVRGCLAGRYVEVRDDINSSWDPRLDKDHWCIKASVDAKTSHFDRVMAYYHVDRVQRYFRDTLGLDILSNYTALNPLQVCLARRDRITRSHYDAKERRAYFARIENNEAYQWTDARDARWLYHEYVHAVTHAIAHWRRPTIAELQDKAVQLIQACAMDEGFADYFACSLAAQHSVETAEFGRLLWNGQERSFRWETLRRLSSDQPPCSPDLGSLSQAPFRIEEEWQASHMSLEKLVYRWAECWGRFLWGLRDRKGLGVEVADMLAAHSLFFLTRWSDFGAGVWALIMADRRLFNGIHEHIIRQLAQTHIGVANQPGQLGQALTEHAQVELSFAVGSPMAVDSLDMGEMWIKRQTGILRRTYLD